MVRISPTGITYEADPRHVDLPPQSLSLAEASPVGPPGTQDPDPDYSMIKANEIAPVSIFSDGVNDSQVDALVFSSEMGETFLLEMHSKTKSCGSPQSRHANLSHGRDGEMQSSVQSNITLGISDHTVQIGASANRTHAVQNGANICVMMFPAQR